MKNNNDYEDLNAVEKKVKDLREVVKNDSLVTMGAMRACEELFEKHKEMMITAREEMVIEIQKSGLSQECANYSLKQLDKVTQMIKKFSSDRLQHYYAKVGAMNAIESCVKMLELQQEEARKRSEQQQTSGADVNKELPVRVEETTNLKIEKIETETIKRKEKNSPQKVKRPDDESTKMGKRLKDIKSRPRKDKI